MLGNLPEYLNDANYSNKEFSTFKVNRYPDFNKTKKNLKQLLNYLLVDNDRDRDHNREFIKEDALLNIISR